LDLEVALVADLKDGHDVGLEDPVGGMEVAENVI
jgi:hypothetical protein